MKSKELIKQLQEIDPTGEEEVCVDNVDIFTLTSKPAYWDGRLQLLIRDPKLVDCYDVIGAKYVVGGSKIVISPMSVTDVLWDDPEAFIDYSELEKGMPYSVDRYRVADDATRKVSRNVTLKVEMDAFYRWVKKKAEEIRPGGDECRGTSDYFFEKHLHVDDPVKDIPPKKEVKDGQEYTIYPSWNERREAMWNETIEVYWRGGWGIRKKDGSAVEGE